MKICLKCEASNMDSEHHCKDCGESLALVPVQSAEDLLDAQMDLIAAHERRRVIMFSFAYGLLCAVLMAEMIFGLVKGHPPLLMLFFLSFPIISYFTLFRTEACAEWDVKVIASRMMQNAEDAKPSSAYELRLQILGFLLLLFGIGALAMIIFKG